MKVALVHELLTMKGGAERVLKILADHFPHAPIYTLLYDEKRLGDWFPSTRIKPSCLQQSLKTQWAIKTGRRLNPHLYLSSFPRAIEQWDFSGYDLVLSTSSAFVHGIITNSAPKHLCYTHSPARYLWDRTHDVINQSGSGILGPLKKIYLQSLFHTLRIWDSEAADRPDQLLAASKEVQRRMELYWRRESDVLYPPIDDYWLQSKNMNTGAMERDDYFIIVSSLVEYKRIELAIEACTSLNLHLKIIGEGPHRKYLEKISGSNIEFYGWRQYDELRNLFARAKATIFPGHEDFGLVPLESMICGTPVIAYKGGGALETVIEGVTGTFFADPTTKSLADTLKKYAKKDYKSEILQEHAKQFSKEKFLKKIQEHIDLCMQS